MCVVAEGRTVPPFPLLATLPLAKLEPLSRLRPHLDPHQLGDGLGVTGDDDLLLDLQARLHLRPPLTEIADADRLHVEQSKLGICAVAASLSKVRWWAP